MSPAGSIILKERTHVAFTLVYKVNASPVSTICLLRLSLCLQSCCASCLFTMFRVCTEAFECYVCFSLSISSVTNKKTDRLSIYEPTNNACGCNVVAYNLMAACTWCQSSTTLHNWWGVSCTYSFVVRRLVGTDRCQ